MLYLTCRFFFYIMHHNLWLAVFRRWFPRFAGAAFDIVTFLIITGSLAYLAYASWILLP